MPSKVRPLGNKEIRQSFFFSESYNTPVGGSATRWLLHAHSVDLKKKTFYYLLGSFPNDITVNIVDIDPDAGTTRYFVGECLSGDVHQTIQRHEPYVFFDGAHQLLVIRQDTGEYFVFDEHDVFYLYFDPKDHFEWLLSVGYHKAREKMVYESEHLHFRPPGADSMRDSLINALGLRLNL